MDKVTIEVSDSAYPIAVEVAKKGKVSVKELAKAVGREPAAIMRFVKELEAMGLVRVTEIEKEVLKLSEEGERYLKEGLPEKRLVECLVRVGEGVSVREIPSRCGISEDLVKVALANAVKDGLVKISKGVVTLVKPPEEAVAVVSKKQRLLEAVAAGTAFAEEVRDFIRRRLVVVERVRDMVVEATDKLVSAYRSGALKPIKMITAVTPEVIKSRAWVGAKFKPFDLGIEVPVVYPGKRHFFSEFISYLREILISMGFEEVRGPHVELEFWNFDALFQPQDHPARDIHDTFYLKYPEYGEVRNPKLFDSVRKMHEECWRYRWDPRKALKLILRTHTTAVSARVLYARGDGTYKVFTIDRNFRAETPDPKHSMEFYQLDGIVVGENLTFRHLLGFLEEFAKRLGMKKIMFKPAYFPFTEPSVEGYVYHPKLGWIEALPGGMIRPEILKALGLEKSRVLAWGLGIDRLAMIALGIDDIRELYTRNLEMIREFPKPRISWYLR